MKMLSLGAAGVTRTAPLPRLASIGLNPAVRYLL